MNYQETQYGFEYGAAKIERKCSDDKKGWVCLGIETPKATLSVYVTRTGKIRIHDQKTGKEFLRPGDLDAAEERRPKCPLIEAARHEREHNDFQ